MQIIFGNKSFSTVKMGHFGKHLFTMKDNIPLNYTKKLQDKNKIQLNLMGSKEVPSYWEKLSVLESMSLYLVQ